MENGIDDMYMFLVLSEFIFIRVNRRNKQILSQIEYTVPLPVRKW